MTAQRSAPAATVTAPRPMRRDAARNQELVIEAAREVISEFGIEASMELVANRAGVGIGTVYRHFPNKDALVEELVRRILDDLLTAARAALALGDGTGLEIFLRALGHSMAEHQGYSGKLVGGISVSECARELQAVLGELLDQAKAHGTIGRPVTLGDIRATTWAIRGIIVTAGPGATHAWQRHLDIHLAALRAEALPTTYRSLSVEELAEINSRPPVHATPAAKPDPCP